MSPRQEREQRKAALLRQIQQQRLDLSASRRDWLNATQIYDRGWSRLVSLRSWAMVASSAMAVVSLRHPRFLVRWARRGLGVWSTWRMVKNLLHKPV
ncbi:YqjK-like family protein [Klebsiella sp. WP8-S18-ESBL-06]|uniref:YqjK-like family protein n=1 Tax=Klebsiella sp. WP8-S18-ESBL-06 TaxID=2675726 RepID=UPI0015DC861C|nr:YqjK-like family protein [Klebsiella sp. WP8-S18-ESBL-06]BBT69341.1 membrane protein [Klebsiella sp. WP8-S18-ESBL-06]